VPLAGYRLGGEQDLGDLAQRQVAVMVLELPDLPRNVALLLVAMKPAESVGLELHQRAVPEDDERGLAQSERLAQQRHDPGFGAGLGRRFRRAGAEGGQGTLPIRSLEALAGRLGEALEERAGM